MTETMTAAERHTRLSGALDVAQADYDRQAAAVAAANAAANEALSVGDMELYGQRKDAEEALRADLLRMEARLKEIQSHVRVANEARHLEEQAARLAEVEVDLAAAELEAQQHAAEVVPLVEALRDALRKGKDAEGRAAGHRNQAHSLRISLGHIPNGTPWPSSYKPLIALLQRNPALDELVAEGVK